MRRLLAVFCLSVVLALPPGVVAGALPESDECVTIQAGVLTYSPGHYLAGEPLRVGFDPFGYNYQAHEFRGSYANAYLGAAGFPPYEGDDAAYLAANPAAESEWFWPFRQDELEMKWNDVWLSDQDCDRDGRLDRHYGYSGYMGSGAWLTNHTSGEEGGHWVSFAKMVAVPADATLSKSFWYTADGKEIGPAIWDEFAIVQELESRSGPFYKTPLGPGLGKW